MDTVFFRQNQGTEDQSSRQCKYESKRNGKETEDRQERKKKVICSSGLETGDRRLET